jgi:uncharacterized protein (DUF1499 family)
MQERNQEGIMTPHMKISILVLVGFVLAVSCGCAAVLAGLGSRWGWWHFRTGFAILRWSAYGGLFSAFVCGVGLIGSVQVWIYDGMIFAILGLMISLGTAGNIWNWKQTISHLPYIHDITTDTQNPPAFVSILPLRKNADNPSEYGGAEIAAQQIKAYPDVKPLVVKLPADAAFEQALTAARSLGWKIIDASKNEGRIEAVDTTFWFGFKDDVIIRITPIEARSRIDVRSVSRVGRSDVGTNAKRIRAFFKEIQG